MDKFKVSPGSKINLTTTFDTVQAYTTANITKRFLRLFKAKGILDEQGTNTALLTAINTSISP